MLRYGVFAKQESKQKNKITSSYQPEPEYQVEYISCLYVVVEVDAGKRQGLRRAVANFGEKIQIGETVGRVFST